MPARTEAGHRAPAALGFRAHSGWASLVAVAGPTGRAGGMPQVLDRRRIELADPAIPRPVQPYHQAENLHLEDAEKLIGHAISEAEAMARKALTAAAAGLEARGYQVIGCGVLLGSGRSLPPLAQILAAHPLIHTAEGELYRGAIVHAGESLGLPITGVRERELLARAGADLSLKGSGLERRIAEMGRPLGPPWRQDEKYAALVAMIALARGPGPIPRPAAGASPSRRKPGD